MIRRMLRFLKKPSVLIAIFLIALIGAVGGVFAFRSKGGESEIVIVRKGDISDEIFVTGTVKANRRVALSFERNGIIDALPYSVGELVAAGGIVAVLKNATERANVAEAEATVGIADAKLATIRRGSRPEEISVREATVFERDIVLKNLLEKTANLIVEAYGGSETALHTTIDPLFESDSSTAPRLSFTSGSQTEQYESESKRVAAEQSLKSFKATTLVQSGFEETALASAIHNLRAIQDLLLVLGGAIRDANGLSAAALEDYKGRVEAARGSVTASITALQNHQNSTRESRSAREKALRELALAKSGGSPEEIREAEQATVQANAKLRAAQAALEKTVLRAPFVGYIASKSVEIGETIATGENMVEFQGTGAFIVEANVPEADVTKLAAGTSAEVTLDAYGDTLVLSAKITAVDPGETEIEGVPTYKTTIEFDTHDEDFIRAFGEDGQRLRSGLTANITVRTILKRDVLIVPSRAVRSENGTLYVLRTASSSEPEKVTVKTGSRSQTREIEIMEGLSVDDRIIVSETR